MKSGLNKDQVAVYRELFDIYDKNGDGIITSAELNSVMAMLKQEPTVEPMQSLVSELEANGDGTLDFHRFVSLVPKELVLDLVDQVAMLMTFRKFDEDGDGFINKEEMRQAMAQGGDVLSDEDLEEIFGGVDLDGDGKIDYEEFAQMMAS